MDNNRIVGNGDKQRELQGNTNVKIVGIRSSRSLGIKKSIDFEVKNRFHNFFAEGMVTSNSHAFSYSAMAALTIYLRFPQFYYCPF